MKPTIIADTSIRAYFWRLGGRVQGVGFRPFVWRLAEQLGVSGWVRNEGRQVSIFACGSSSALAQFHAALIRQAPAPARPVLDECTEMPVPDCTGFVIQPSVTAENADNVLLSDQSLCQYCKDELFNPENRRFRYPFISCAQCGPRYTITRRLPFDRVDTCMQPFPLCSTCQQEYDDPENHRFHAQTIACDNCGPALEFHQGDQRVTGNQPALRAAVAAIKNGAILAVKGVGGYHLLCRAQDTTVIQRLRQRKHRPHKPLAIMVPWSGDDGLEQVRQWAHLNEASSTRLLSPERPIVLLPCRNDHPNLLELVPGLHEIGIMLPYSPLHALLLDDLGEAVVTTSANVSGDPVITCRDDANTRLQGIADGFLHHNRPILRPADDPVYRAALPGCAPLRQGRSDAPQERRMHTSLAVPSLALGGQMKVTLALGWKNRALISPHIGDLDSPRGLALLEQLVTEYQQLTGIQAGQVVCDAHPNYTSHRWAMKSGLPVIPIAHHHAHASALYDEKEMHGPAIVFAWDGNGLGTDGTLWGGETFLGQPGHWRRVASLRRFSQPGSERASREPWRTATALCWEAGLAWRHAPTEAELLHKAWIKNVNSPVCSAAGRLFDAAAALCGLLTHASYEAQGPMWLEAIADKDCADYISLPLERDDAGIWRSNWAPLIEALLDERRSPAYRAALFHNSLAHTVLVQAQQLRSDHGTSQLGLCGGVFQNALLTRRCCEYLKTQDFHVHLHQQLPSNDAAISYGQLVEAAAMKDDHHA